jgi:ATP-dependent DNA ligase
VFPYAFDVLELDGRDLRAQRWDARRALLTQVLDWCQQDGIRCYRSGRCREWIKVKNRAHPAFERAVLIALSKRGSRSR